MTKQLKSLFLGVTLCASAAAVHASITEYVLEDYEWNRGVPFASSAGGSTVTVTNNRVQVVTSVASTFLQFLQSSNFSTAGQGLDAVNAVLAGGSINIHLQTKAAEVNQAFTVRLVVNSDAWTNYPTGGNYRDTGATVSFAAGVDANKTLTFNYTTNSDFYQAMLNYSTGHGTYLHFVLDNSGSPGVITPQTFYVSGVAIDPPYGANFVLDDYNTNRSLQFSSTAWPSTQVIESNYLHVTSGTGSFVAYLNSSFLGRTGTNIDALLNGNGIVVSLQALGGQPSSFAVRLVVNSDAWVSGSGGNYRGYNQVTISSTKTGGVTLTFPYSASSDFMKALANFKAGGGTYFQFALDNAGYPSLSSPIQFYVNSVGVRPAPIFPPNPTLALNYSAQDTAWKLTWPSAPALFHLQSAEDVAGSWTWLTNSYSTTAGTNTALLPGTNNMGFFRMFKY